MAINAPHTPSEVLLRNDPLIAGHEDDARRAFGTLLEAVGTGSFSSQTIDYLRTYLEIDQSIIALFSRDAKQVPELLFHNLGSARDCTLYLSYLQHHCLPAIFASAPRGEAAIAVKEQQSGASRAFERTFHEFLGIEQELRVAMPIDEDSIAMLLLGKERWSEAESGLAVRCAAFIRPTIRVHTRSRRALAGGDWRLDHIRSSLGDDKLTSREFDVAMLILAGESTCAIAGKLGISVATVKVHRRHIYAKLKISGQAELFALAFRGVSL